MKTDLIINSKAGNKAVAKTITNVNPEATNDKLETFAGMVNALSTNTFQGGSRVDKSSLSEQGGGSSGSIPTGYKRVPTLTVSEFSKRDATVSYSGDGSLNVVNGSLSSTLLTANAISGVIYANETDNFSPVISAWNLPYADKLVTYLPFDDSAPLDLCGGNWSFFGSPLINNGCLHLDGNTSYLSRFNGITLGGKDFTISGWFNMTSPVSNYPRVFAIFSTWDSYEDVINISRNTDMGVFTIRVFDNLQNWNGTLDTFYHFELDYSHTTGETKFFVNGVLTATLSQNINRRTFARCYLGRSNFSDNAYFIGSIDDFKIYDGIALHSADFTPPARSD